MSVFWKDTMSIHRWKDIIEDGVTRNKLVEVGSLIKCHYSKSKLRDINQSNIPEITTTNVIFCSIDVDVMEGDHVELRLRNGRVMKLTLGECFPYSNKYECIVKRVETA